MITNQDQQVRQPRLSRLDLMALGRIPVTRLETRMLEYMGADKQANNPESSAGSGPDFLR